MKAMILCAGYGKRLNPLTLKHPKPLLEMGKETLLSNTLKFLKQCKINEVVINVHYLGDQIINYINENKFNLKINIVREKEKILDTGGGVLNAIKHFQEPFLIINPDTIWNQNYLTELELMQETFQTNKKIKCLMLLAEKEKSFDKSFKGDFNLENNLINKKHKNDLKYIYTGMQIIQPELFYKIKTTVFSINEIWNDLIKKNELYGMGSNIKFLHISTLDIYKKLNIK